MKRAEQMKNSQKINNFFLERSKLDGIEQWFPNFLKSRTLEANDYSYSAPLTTFLLLFYSLLLRNEIKIFAHI